MIQQNTPPNLLISVIQEKSHSFDGGISNKIYVQHNPNRKWNYLIELKSVNS